MRNLYESLDEVTVKDTLEGDNMYTCSQCGKKVRAEKRACFKKLPHILCFNTMRYTFNMLTMLKEKVWYNFWHVYDKPLLMRIVVGQYAFLLSFTVKYGRLRGKNSNAAALSGG